MLRAYSQKIRLKLGQPPGAALHVGDKKVSDTLVTLWSYGPEGLVAEKTLTPPYSLTGLDPKLVHWVQVEGLHDSARIGELTAGLNLDALLTEDILNTTQRPKLDENTTEIFLVLRTLGWTPVTPHVESEQVSIILRDNMVVSFHEGSIGVFTTLRERIRQLKGKICKQGADYLAYCLTDVTVDHYLPVLEALDERIEELEARVSANYDPKVPRMLHALQREILALRRVLVPMQELVFQITKQEHVQVKKVARTHFKDVQDHLIQELDILDSQKEHLAGILNMHLSAGNLQMNEVMKVLALISTLFIPPSFVAAVYGMNFHNMPELDWKWGYFGVLGLMLSMGLTMLWFFRRRRWI